MWVYVSQKDIIIRNVIGIAWIITGIIIIISRMRESTFVKNPEDKIKGLILICFFLGLLVAIFFYIFRK